MSRINNKDVGGYRINGKIVGGIRSNGKLWDGFETGPVVVPVTRGVATRVGNLNNFGVNEANPRGLASHNDVLYMIGASRGMLYSLNPDTGEVIASVAVTNGSSLGSLVSHNGVLYAGFANSRLIVSINPSSGATTTVFRTAEASGMASHEGNLYAVDSFRDRLHLINTTNGQVSVVGSSSSFGVGETEPTGLASHDGKLYMTGKRNDVLYVLDTTTGRATRVGNATRFGNAAWDFDGMTSHNGVLYAVSANGAFGGRGIYTLS